MRVHTARRPADAGFTLIEVSVTLGVLSVVMAVFTGAMVSVYQATNATQSRSVAESQLHQAFQRLDQVVRTSTGITAPNEQAIGGAWYVELYKLDEQGRAECRQLRLAGGVLQMQEWTPGSPPAAGWAGQTLAANVAMPPPDTGPSPFKLEAAGTAAYQGSNYISDSQVLVVSLAVSVRSGTVTSNGRFSAWNTRGTAAPTNPCGEGRPTR